MRLFVLNIILLLCINCFSQTFKRDEDFYNALRKVQKDVTNVEKYTMTDKAIVLPTNAIVDSKGWGVVTVQRSGTDYIINENRYTYQSGKFFREGYFAYSALGEDCWATFYKNKISGKFEFMEFTPFKGGSQLRFYLVPGEKDLSHGPTFSEGSTNSSQYSKGPTFNGVPYNSTNNNAINNGTYNGNSNYGSHHGSSVNNASTPHQTRYKTCPRCKGARTVAENRNISVAHFGTCTHSMVTCRECSFRYKECNTYHTHKTCTVCNGNGQVVDYSH